MDMGPTPQAKEVAEHHGAAILPQGQRGGRRARRIRYHAAMPEKPAQAPDDDLARPAGVIVANLEPRTISGELSQGMILAASDQPEPEGDERPPDPPSARSGPCAAVADTGRLP